MDALNVAVNKQRIIVNKQHGAETTRHRAGDLNQEI